MKTLIISPTYNEHKNIAALIENVFTINSEYHLLIVDDTSPDGTGDIVRDLQKKYPNLHLEVRAKKDGLGRAYIHGFHWALNRDYDAIVQMDADMSHDPTEIPAMLAHLKKHDLVIGSRYIQGVSVVNWPIRRLVMSYGANLYCDRKSLYSGRECGELAHSTLGHELWGKSLLSHCHRDAIKGRNGWIQSMVQKSVSIHRFG